MSAAFLSNVEADALDTADLAKGNERSGRDDAGLARLRAAVACGDDGPATLLNLALAEQRAGDGPRAERLLQELESRYPDWDEPPLRIAERHRVLGAAGEAEQAYRRALAINPRRPEALTALAALLMARGESHAAQPLLERCCAVAPSRAESWDLLGLSLLMAGDPRSAEAAFAEAHGLDPDCLDYALHRIDAAFAAGTAEAELSRVESAGASDPLDVGLLTVRGVLLDRLGRWAEAADVLETALALDPEAKLAAAVLGCALTALNRLAQAQTALRRAIRLDPDNPHLRNNLAATLMRLHKHAEAREVLEELIARHGSEPSWLCNLANATVSVGLQQEARELAQQAISLAPDAVLPWRTLCNTLPYCDGVSGAELLDALRSCASRLPRASFPNFTNDPDPDRKLRIGLLSGTLRTHPVGWLTVAGFEALEPSGFEIVCLSQTAAEDAIARRFRALAAEWHAVETLDDAALAERGRSLGIDVLIDLGGYGDAGRMPACAMRLAPVQIKWVGMQNHSTGLAEIDWFLTDRWETPPSLEHLYTERLLRLPDGYVCYSSPTHAPDVGPLPALRNGHVTFGCFNNLAKITPRVLATWATIMRQVPRSRLILKTHQFTDRPTADRVLQDFAAHGIDATRIGLRGSSQHRAFLDEYNLLDLVLDPFPYSGGLTTCEALWMGVPTLTMPGETFASRHSTSHMRNVGLSDWVAPTLQAYVELAIAKASEPHRLADLRNGLRARVKSSPLCDSPRFGRNLGQALRHAWHQWCLAPQQAEAGSRC